MFPGLRRIEHGKRLTAIKNVTFNEPFFQGQFPGNPVMPGVLILEALAQASGLLVQMSAAQAPETQPLYYLVKIDKARFTLLLSERRVLRDGPTPDGAAKLLTFLPVDPRSTAAGLAALLEDDYAEAVAGVGIRHEQLIEIPGAHEGRLPPLFSAVDVLWFASVDDAVAFATGDPVHEVGWLLAGTAFGVQRLIAEPIVVV